MRTVVERLLANAIAAAIDAGEIVLPEPPAVEVERPRDPAHGDWATSVALRSAREAGVPPRELAAVIARRVGEHPDIAGVEVAGPGFINVRLAPSVFQREVLRVREERERYGAQPPRGERVQIEFVSANPVGPMHVGHGRWAALGDSIARLLEHAGYEVEREFYVNDAGVQMDIFAASVSARYMELCGRTVEFPEDGYRGAYITDIAREILEDEGDLWAERPDAEREAHFKEKAYAQVLEHLKRVLHDFGVDFDVWFSERTLHAPSADGAPNEIERAIARLREAGHVYDHEGAVWFRSSAFGDDKDRVLVKADGAYTYFAADVAYHWDKLGVRGFDRVIDIWGADHHGYVKRMEAACAALGFPGRLEVIIGQMVNLFQNGEIVRMSKRTGEMVTFEDLLDEVGPDAARYFFLRRSTDQALDFDIGLAKQRSNENPVFYVQYAHARICSILRKAAKDEGAREMDELASSLIPEDVDVTLLVEDAEMALLRKIAEFPDVVSGAAEARAPHRLTRYAEDLATAFHQFYTVCRVVDPERPDLTAARLALCDATRSVIALALALLGVSAPFRM